MRPKAAPAMPAEKPKQPGRAWTREELLLAFDLYFRLPFGQLHHGNPQIQELGLVIDRTVGAVSMKLVNIASLDKNITDTGRAGLKNASQADKKMWREIQDNWGDFPAEVSAARSSFDPTHGGDVIIDPTHGGDVIIDPTHGGDVIIDPTHRGDVIIELDVPVGRTRQVKVEIREGQGFFRDNLHRIYEGTCCITGANAPDLLDAAHIIPWKQNKAIGCDPRNGLLLTTLHHRAFDKGLITIDENYHVKVSPIVKKMSSPFIDSALLKYDGQPMRMPSDPYIPKQEYLAQHREETFQPRLPKRTRTRRAKNGPATP